MGKIEKTFDRRIYDLKGHLRILKDALQKTETDDIYYYKVMAASLRALVSKMSNSTPLLLDIAQKMGLVMWVNRNELKNIDGEIKEIPVKCTLEDYLELRSCMHNEKSITKNMLIRAVADKDSLAHEDLDLDEFWPTFEAMIGGRTPYFIRELKEISKRVIELGDGVVSHYEQRAKKPS